MSINIWAERSGDGVRLFSVVHNGRAGVNGQFHLNITLFYCKGDWMLEQAALSHCASPYLWRCTKPDWTQSWATCCSWPWFEQRRWTLQRSLPTSSMLWVKWYSMPCILFNIFSVGGKISTSYFSNWTANKKGIILHSAKLNSEYLPQVLWCLDTSVQQPGSSGCECLINKKEPPPFHITFIMMHNC